MAAAERLREQEFTIADYIRLSELRDSLAQDLAPPQVIAGWVTW